MPWKVPIQASSRGRLSSWESRSRSSPAAASVKVTASTASGSAPCSTSQRKRRTMVKVFPVPGPAAIRKAPSGPASIAARCSGVGSADGLAPITTRSPITASAYSRGRR